MSIHTHKSHVRQVSQILQQCMISDREQLFISSNLLCLAEPGFWDLHTKIRSTPHAEQMAEGERHRQTEEKAQLYVM